MSKGDMLIFLFVVLQFQKRFFEGIGSIEVQLHTVLIEQFSGRHPA